MGSGFGAMTARRSLLAIGCVALTLAAAAVPSPALGQSISAGPAAADLSLADLGGLGQRVGVHAVATASNGTSSFALSRWDGSHVRVQSLRVNAALWRSNAVDLSPAGADARQAGLALTPAGTGTIAWVLSSGGAEVVQAVRIDPKGRVGRVLDISSGPMGPQGLTVVSSANGTTTVAWTRSNGVQPVVQAVRIDARGRKGPVLDLSAPGAGAYYPDVATAPDGSNTVVWTRLDGSRSIVQAVRIDPKGRKGRVLDLSSHVPGPPEYPRIETATNGVSTVVWRAPTGVTEVVRAIRIDARGRKGRVLDLTAPAAVDLSPRLATSSSGVTTIGWARASGASSIIQAVRLDAKGRRSRVLDVTTPVQDLAGWSFATAPDGTTTVAWSGSNGTNAVIRATRIDPRGRKGRVLNLSSRGRDARSPKLALAPNGIVTIAWTRWDDPDGARSAQAIRLR